MGKPCLRCQVCHAKRVVQSRRVRVCDYCLPEYQLKQQEDKRWSVIRKEAYNELVGKFGERCMICGFVPDKKRLCVDHDHDTDVIRGLLCNWCNRGLGWFTDNVVKLAAAVVYLERPPAIGLTQDQQKTLDVARKQTFKRIYHGYWQEHEMGPIPQWYWEMADRYAGTPWVKPLSILEKYELSDEG